MHLPTTFTHQKVPFQRYKGLDSTSQRLKQGSGQDEPNFSRLNLSLYLDLILLSNSNAVDSSISHSLLQLL